MTPKEKAEDLLMQYMVVPKDGAYAVNVEHGRKCTLKTIIEVQHALAENGILSEFWYETGQELEKIYKLYLKEYKPNNGE
jgi:hypothetical protein